MRLRRGSIFRHARWLDINAPVGERKYALCRVTAVRRGQVYWTYANDLENKGAMYFAADKAEKYVAELISY